MNTQDIAPKVEALWATRARNLALNPKSMAYKRAEVDYFSGAIAALQAMFPNEENPNLLSKAVPVGWPICIMSGRPIVDLKKYEEAPTCQ